MLALRSTTSARLPRTTSRTRSRRLALARAYGIPPHAVRDGLRAFRPDPHRIAHVATVDGVATSTTPRRPTRTRRPRRLRRTPRRLGRRWPGEGRRLRRARARRRRAAARRGADGPGPGHGRRGTGATRARGPGRRGRRHGHWDATWTTSWRRRRAAARPAGRHRAAGACLRVDGHVPRLRRARRRLRCRRAPACRRRSVDGASSMTCAFRTDRQQSGRRTPATRCCTDR